MRTRIGLWSLAALGMALLAPGAIGQLKAGTKVPDAVVKDLKGRSVRVSRLRGSAPAVVNFFATW